MRGLSRTKIAVVGLGYVGLPLAIEFGKKYSTVGFDIDAERIRELRAGKDRTLEAQPSQLAAARRLKFSSSAAKMAGCRVFIVTVPTPIDRHKRPDLGPLVGATKRIGRILRKGAIVIYESTVYPGCTEEVCVPILEEESGLRFNRDFYCGYSPERINPGDARHRLTTIRKITSGSTPQAADFVDALYSSVITAGTHRAASIRIAEAAKVIENIQRDVNIALINELAVIFERLNLDTEEVLQAAGTKWNFQPFRPGLVGGHCIGVDPYYLTHKAQEIGYHPEMILAGRRVNDNMGSYIAQRVIKGMTERRILVAGAKVLVMGLAFKENCPDVRNSKVVDIVRELEDFDAEVSVYDPWVNADLARQEYGIKLLTAPKRNGYDAIVIAVAHGKFRELGVRQIRALGKERHLLFDVKYLFPADQTDQRL